MPRSLTIRVDAPLRARLEERAAATGRSLSEVIRRILENALAARTLGSRIGHLRGRVALPARSADAWRRSLRERNWRS